MADTKGFDLGFANAKQQFLFQLMATNLRKPEWLKVRLPFGETYQSIKSKRIHLGLSTVCEEARCPNMGECWGGGTATFMVLGDTCTRACRFCSVKTAKHPPLPDLEEPEKLALTIQSLQLKYVVLTTVDRDDLVDQGAQHICRCISETLLMNPGLYVEILMPDFRGDKDLINLVANSGAQVISHNVECIERLTPMVRDRRANYQQSLEVLNHLHLHRQEFYTKSSIMVGWDESDEEILQTMQDIRAQGTDFLTIGQYLQPNRNKLEVQRYFTPEQFQNYEREGLKMGFRYVASGPLVRSSYKAGEHYLRTMLDRQRHETDCKT